MVSLGRERTWARQRIRFVGWEMDWVEDAFDGVGCVVG